MNDDKRYRVLMIGTGTRAATYYCPIIEGMEAPPRPDLPGLELVGICGRGAEKTRALAERYGVPPFTDVQRALDETRPDLAVVAVTGDQNGPVGLAVVRAGVSLLTETPVAMDPAEGVLIGEEARKRGVHVEVAEQNFRHPVERLKHQLIESGLFGRVFAVYNDFRAHGYHGTSMLRWYLGFDDPVRRVIALNREFHVEPHVSELHGIPDRDREEWTVGLLEFAGGAIGMFHFTDITYDAPMRWHGFTKFFGEKGTVVGDEIRLLDAARRGRVEARIDREWVPVGDTRIVGRATASTEPPFEWVNPYAEHPWDEDRIGVAECLVSLVRAMEGQGEPEYGAVNGAIDQALALALDESARHGGRPVEMGDDPWTFKRLEGDEGGDEGRSDRDREVIHTRGAPEAIGPYEQAIRTGGLLFTSGQIPLNPESGEIEGDSIEEQTRRVLDNLKAVLEAGGSSLDRVVKVGVYLTDLGEFGRFNEVYSEYFSRNKPARSTVQVANLPKGVKIEADAVALAG